jgi:hypothetical protein
VPNRNQYVLVARELKKQLNGKAFMTIHRREITEILRGVSGEPTTRIKSGVAREMTQVLLEQALRCYPSIEETDMDASVRIFRAGSMFSNLVDLIVHPSAETDADVGEMLKKIKGSWNWSTPAAGQNEKLPPFES